MLALAAAGALVACSRAAGPARPSPDALREHLSAILSSRAYQVNPPPTWRFQQWILEHLGRFLDWLGRIATADPFGDLPLYLWWTIVAGCLLALALILYHIFITFRILLAGTPRRPRDVQWVSRKHVSPEEALREARDAAAEGDFELAVRRLYEAALLRLDRRGLLGYVPSRTNWENLRGLRSAPVRTIMAPLTRVADSVFYGGREATAEVYADCQERVRTLWDAEA